eukprot:scaffold8421_cov114-Isochrysis_galbana.AAC.6
MGRLCSEHCSSSLQIRARRTCASCSIPFASRSSVASSEMKPVRSSAGRWVLPARRTLAPTDRFVAARWWPELVGTGEGTGATVGSMNVSVANRATRASIRATMSSTSARAEDDPDPPPSIRP